MLQHTLHKLHVMTVSLLRQVLQPSMQLAKVLSHVPWLFCAAPCSFGAFAVLLEVYCAASVLELHGELA
jgi:hypothetical protein